MVGTLVTVAAFDNSLEAGYWQALLEAQGIPVVVSDREVVAMVWQIARAVGRIKLQVPVNEAGRATAILESLRRASPYRPPAAPEASRALRAAFLGILFPPLQLYSLWLLVRLARRWRDLSPPDRRRMKLAALVDLWLPIVVAAYCSVDWSL
ncbi:MAG: putative signal transducing protein [Planctomycetota bacterium]